MSVDPYSLCPCGSGQKLKFCCSDLAGDIEKIHRMLEGDQPRAALNHATQTLRKAPGRGSLLDLKATIELSLEEWDEAAATIEEFKRADPTNPAAHAQAAVLAASRNAGAASVDPLQDALERLGEELPTRVLQAVGAVGQALLVAGDFVAARAHLWLYQGIAGDDDGRAIALLTRLNRSGGLPLVLRDNLYLREAPVGHPAEAAHDQAQLLASRGQWRRAAQALDELCARHADAPFLAYNRGVVYGWLGDTRKFVAGLRGFAAFAESGSASIDDAVEATAIASLLDADRREPPVDVVRTTFAVADEEALVDRLTRDQRTHAYRMEPAELAAIEGPPPRATHLLLDGAPPAAADLTAETTPRIVGALSFYGRQTDRPERLELVVDRDDRHADALRLVDDVLGPALGETVGEERIGEAAVDEPTLRPRLHFPEETPLERRREVLAEARRGAVLDGWLTRSRAALGGASPVGFAEAAGSGPAALVPLAAELLLLEQSLERGHDAELFAEVRRRVGLPEPATIDAASADFQTLPLSRLDRVDLASLDDDDLAVLYERATLAGAATVQLRLARVAVDRPAVVDRVGSDELYYHLVSLEPDTAEALRWLEQARRACDAAGRSNAGWDILELELSVMTGRMEDANRLVEHIRRDHLSEPGVAEQLYELLSALGAVPPPGEAAAAGPPAPAVAPPAAPQSDSKLWTPGEPSPAPAGGSKIWTPG